ncbi:MAG: hydratase [Clostridia bacterium]|nr:hydratase [Clostridia bacterium]
MIQLIEHGVYYVDGKIRETGLAGENKSEAAKKTIAAGILSDHNENGGGDTLRLKFDALASHDITYVGIIQTARASGLESFPVPYVLTNCHNSLCAVGGTINEDDHVFGLSAAIKYGGIFVPPHQAVIHQYMREMMSGCGKMIIGSDSHTRYGALGTLAVGEGGPELVKQLLGRKYEIKKPDVVLVYLEGKPRRGVGPQDIALAIIGKVFKAGFVKNCVMEFAGPGVHGLSVDYRNGIDVMTTETACLSSVWTTDEKVREYYKVHGREQDYKLLEPGNGAYYDKAIVVDLAKAEPMIALPFHPGNAYKLKDFIENPGDLLRETEKRAAEVVGERVKDYPLLAKIKNGKVTADQGVIAGCSGGTYENIVKASHILKGKSTGSGSYTLNVYPASQPVNLALMKNGAMADLMSAGAAIKTAFCGPCFGAGDVPPNNGFSIRHTTRNFPNREGSRPQDGQLSWVALMDAMSIAATSANGGVITSAADIDFDDSVPAYGFDDSCYKARVYNGFGLADKNARLVFGPNITDWPSIPAMEENLLLSVASVIGDEVTTTDELIPSGETSSYRSNPMRLAEFALSRKDPAYVSEAKRIKELNAKRIAEGASELFDGIEGAFSRNTAIASVVAARRPGDGSAREQAASCQRVLGGGANIASAYATKRYRSNLLNWGMLPFVTDDESLFDGGLERGDRIFIKDIRAAVADGKNSVKADIYGKEGKKKTVTLSLGDLTDSEREVLLAGCLMNYYKKQNAG